MSKQDKQLQLKTPAAKTLPATPSTRADSSTPAGISLDQKVCNRFEEMEESRNDRIQVALDNHLKKSRTAPPAQ